MRIILDDGINSRKERNNYRLSQLELMRFIEAWSNSLESLKVSNLVKEVEKFSALE